MGTNYYAVRNRPTVQDPIHIGKCSFGWLFNFQSQNETWSEPKVVWSTFDQVKDWLKKYTVDSNDYVIMDEYEKIISYDDFIKMVEERQKDDICRSNPNNFAYARNVNGYRFSDGDFS